MSPILSGQVVVVAPPGIPIEDPDDNGNYNGGWTPGPVELELGNNGAPVNGYFYFRDVGVPQGASIVAAYMNLVASASLSDTTVNLSISAEDHDNPTRPNNAGDAAGRVRTSAVVTWSNVGPWVVNSVYQTPSLAAIVQELVNRPGFAGQNMLFFVDDNSSTPTATRKPHGRSAGVARAATLVINYYVPPVPSWLEIEVDNSGGGALTDYQVLVEVPWQAGMSQYFTDICFYADDQTTLLWFWKERYTQGVTATFWVNMPTIGAGATETIYIKYAAGTPARQPDIRRTFLDGDDFNRANLNEPATWTKHDANPLTGANYGDVSVLHENGMFYLYGGAYPEMVLGGIRLWTAPDDDPTTLTDQGEKLPLGAEGAWDDHWVSDPHVIKVGATYHMWYSGCDGVGVTGIKIGHATAPAITGPWTKDGANPVFSKVGYGVNEPSVTHDGSTYHMLFTYSTAGGTTDVGSSVIDTDIGYATSADGIVWVEQAPVYTGDHWMDQLQIQDSEGHWHCFLNDIGLVMDMWQGIGRTVGGPYSYPSRGGALLHGANYDAMAPYAPSIVLVNGVYYMYYQGQSVDGAKICLATGSGLQGDWWISDPDGAYVSTGARLYKYSGSAGWSRAESHWFPKEPPYIIETEIEVAAAAEGPGAGVWVATDATGRWAVLLDINADWLRLYRVGDPAYEDSNSGYTLELDTVYRIRATVTATSISVDFYDGSWHSAVLSTAGQTLLPCYGGYIGHGTTTFHFYANDWRARKYASPEPTTAIV